MPNVGFLAHVEVLRAELAVPALSAARAAEINRLIFNDRVDALMTLVFIVLVAVILADSARVWIGIMLGGRAVETARMETAA
jgi:carbon starvation protein